MSDENARIMKQPLVWAIAIASLLGGGVGKDAIFGSTSGPDPALSTRMNKLEVQVAKIAEQARDSIPRHEVQLIVVPLERQLTAIQGSVEALHKKVDTLGK